MARPISAFPTSSASSTSARDGGLTHTLALIGIGALLAFAHRAWDPHLGMPGHFGLVWMAGIMLSRQWSGAGWAATLSACGYVGGTAALAGSAYHGLAQAPLYLLSTLVVDVAWRLRGGRLGGLLIAVLVGGLAFALKPLALILWATAAHTAPGALRFGALYPVVTHFCFGAVGAVIGTVLGRGGARR